MQTSSAATTWVESGADADSDSDPATIRIGEVAERAGVSTRTLRYYEELGLLPRSPRSAGGNRLFRPAEVERVQRIRAMQELMGLDLDEIRTVLDAEDRMEELRRQYRRGRDLDSRRALLAEALALNERQVDLVRSKLERLQAFYDELLAKAARYRELQESIGAVGGLRPGPTSPAAGVHRSEDTSTTRAPVGDGAGREPIARH